MEANEITYEDYKFDKAFDLLDDNSIELIENDPFDEALAFKFPEQIEEILSNKKRV